MLGDRRFHLIPEHTKAQVSNPHKEICITFRKRRAESGREILLRTRSQPNRHAIT